MPGYQLILKKLFELEESVSQSYKYSLHVLILNSLALMPWLVSTDLLIERILPLLETRIDAVSPKNKCHVSNKKNTKKFY